MWTGSQSLLTNTGLFWERVGLSTSHRGVFSKPEGGRRFEHISVHVCVPVHVCVCVYKYDIITHRLETTLIHSCDSGRGGEPKMTSQSSILSGEEVQELQSPVMQSRLHSRCHRNHPNGCSSPWCGVSLSPSLERVQWSGWRWCCSHTE